VFSKISSSRKAFVRKAIALLAISSVALLAACSNVNAAATVGGKVISVETIQTSFNSIMKMRGTIDTSSMSLPTGADLDRSILNVYLSTEVIAQAAATKKVTVSDAEVKKYQTAQLASIGGTANLNKALVQNALATEDLFTYFERALYVQKIAKVLSPTSDTTVATNYILNFAKKLKVTINTRYGKWDATQVSVVPADPTSGAVTTPAK